MREVALPGYADIAGNRAVLMLRRPCNDDRTEFTMVTIWDGLENITAFAGPDPEHAVFYPRDEQFVIDAELTVRHYEVSGISGLAGRARIDAMMSATSPACAAAALRGRAERPDYRPVLVRLGMPAFVCAGSADPWSDAAVTATIVSSLKHPELLVIDGAGHLPNLEASQQFNDALGGFLRACAQARLTQRPDPRSAGPAEDDLASPSPTGRPLSR